MLRFSFGLLGRKVIGRYGILRVEEEIRLEVGGCNELFVCINNKN